MRPAGNTDAARCSCSNLAFSGYLLRANIFPKRNLHFDVQNGLSVIQNLHFDALKSAKKSSSQEEVIKFYHS